MSEIQTEHENRIEIPPQPGRKGVDQNHETPKKENVEKDDAGKEAAKKPTKPFKWTPFKIALVAVFAGVLIVTGTIYFISANNHATTDDAYTTGHLHSISSRVAGTVIGILVDDNQFVKQGQVLVKLDPRDYQVKVDQARANYLKTKANDDRIRVVKGDGAISKQDYDLSAAALLVDGATLEDA